MSKQNFDTELISSMKTTRTILRIIGTWPLTSNSSIIEKIGKRIINFICYFLFILTLIPATLQIIIREKNIHVKLRRVGPVLNCLMSFIQYTILLYRSEEILKGAQQMRQDWNDVSKEDRKILLSKAKIGKRLVQLAVMFMYGGGLGYRTIIPLTKGFLANPNSTVRPLPCASYFGNFNEQQTPAYEIIFLLQVLGGFIVFSVRCGLCGLSAFFVLHVCGQLGILIDRLNNLAEKNDLEDIVVDQRISAIIELQIKAWTFLKHIEQIVEYMCMIEIVGCTVLVCLGGYYMILDFGKHDIAVLVTYVVITTSFVVSIFTFCYIGQLLDNESTDVALASCTLDWYRLPMRKARCLVFIIAMSNTPMKVTAGKMMDMCLSSFTDLIKTSVAYLNVLRTMT